MRRDCKRCNGTGKCRPEGLERVTMGGTEVIVCPECGGRGYIEVNDEEEPIVNDSSNNEVSKRRGRPKKVVSEDVSK